MDKILKNDPVYDHFSKNEFLEYYKDGLVKTGNVDHIIPFKHSQNKRGIKLDYMRQNQIPKMYPASACQELAKEYLQNSKNQKEPPSNLHPSMKRDHSIASMFRKDDHLSKAPKIVTNISQQAIAEEGADAMASDRDSILRESRGSVTSSIRGRFGNRKAKKGSSKEKVDKLVKAYFK